MDVKEISVPAEATTAAILKPTTVIANTISREYLKILELKEFCKFAESDLKEYDAKVKILIFSKTESAKVKDEYKRKNKINISNSESLLAAKNELYKYKCELKSSYIVIEKALKSKKLKYKKIISSYEIDWQKALKEFNTNSMAAELHTLKQENTLLEITMEKQEKLYSCTEKQFAELTKNIRNMFLKKIVELSEVMIQFKQLSDSQKKNKKVDLLKLPNSSQQNFEFILFGQASPSTGKNSFDSESNDEASFFNSVAIDVSMFDDIMVPSENLESQHLEEDSIYCTTQNKDQFIGPLNDQEENSGVLNSVKHYQQTEDEKLKKSSNDTGINSAKISDNTAMANENESQYFRLHSSESSKQPENKECNAEKLKSVNIGAQVPLHHAQENEEDTGRERQMEYEECLSEGSSENQFFTQRDIYDRQCGKTSSFSSDDFPPSAEHTNEESESPEKLCEEEKNSSLKPVESEKNNFQTFKRFFTNGNDQDSQKPSIFWLF